MRHRQFCGKQHLDPGSLEPSTFHCSCGRVIHRKGDLTRHSRFCEATYIPDLLVILSRGYPRILQSSSN